LTQHQKQTRAIYSMGTMNNNGGFLLFLPLLFKTQSWLAELPKQSFSST
jgi:hypothetical protein